MKVLENNGIELSKSTLSRNEQVSEIESRLFDVNKYEVTAPRGGYGEPDCVTIYDSTNGRYLGKAGKDYAVLKPQQFFDSIVKGLDETNFDFSKNKIEYKEINEGKVIEFRIPLKKFKVKSDAQLNDVISTYMLCSTSFDGTQSSRSAILTERLVCTNGLVVNQREAYKAFKHTQNMNDKGLIITNTMASSVDLILGFKGFAEKLSQIKVTETEKNRLIKAITGYNVKDYAKMHTARKAIIDGIQNGLNFELENTGINDTAWSLFNAFTYHSNHDLDGQLRDSKNISLTVGTGYKFNNAVQKTFMKQYA